MDEVDKAFYNLTVAQRDGAWREVEILKGALIEALALVTRVAEQQAMPDDFWMPAVERLKRFAQPGWKIG